MTIPEMLLVQWKQEKKEFEKNKSAKIIKSLAQLMRLFINEVRQKRAVPPQHRRPAQEMLEYLIDKIPSLDGEAFKGVLRDVQYARKFLGKSVDSGSAIKAKLSATERRRVRKLASGSVQSKRAQDSLNSDDVHISDLDDGNT